MKLFISFDTDQNLFFVTFVIKVNYLQYPEVPYVPMCFNLSISNCSLTLRWESWEQLFFFDFSKKGIFKGYFDFFFDRERQSTKNLLHYKPCPLKSLSGRKSWEIFALSIEKINFYFSDILIKWRILTQILVFFWASNHTKHYQKQWFLELRGPKKTRR